MMTSWIALLHGHEGLQCATEDVYGTLSHFYGQIWLRIGQIIDLKFTFTVEHFDKSVCICMNFLIINISKLGSKLVCFLLLLLFIVLFFCFCFVFVCLFFRFFIIEWCKIVFVKSTSIDRP